MFQHTSITPLTAYMLTPHLLLHARVQHLFLHTRLYSTSCCMHVYSTSCCIHFDTASLAACTFTTPLAACRQIKSAKSKMRGLREQVMSSASAANLQHLLLHAGKSRVPSPRCRACASRVCPQPLPLIYNTSCCIQANQECQVQDAGLA